MTVILVTVMAVLPVVRLKADITAMDPHLVSAVLLAEMALFRGVKCVMILVNLLPVTAIVRRVLAEMERPILQPVNNVIMREIMAQTKPVLLPAKKHIAEMAFCKRQTEMDKVNPASRG
jgi:hypothetical protein